MTWDSELEWVLCISIYNKTNKTLVRVSKGSQLSWHIYSWVVEIRSCHLCILSSIQKLIHNISQSFTIKCNLSFSPLNMSYLNPAPSTLQRSLTWGIVPLAMILYFRTLGVILIFFPFLSVLQWMNHKVLSFFPSKYFWSRPTFLYLAPYASQQKFLISTIVS